MILLEERARVEMWESRLQRQRSRGRILRSQIKQGLRKKLTSAEAIGWFAVGTVLWVNRQRTGDEEEPERHPFLDLFTIGMTTWRLSRLRTHLADAIERVEEQDWLLQQHEKAIDQPPGPTTTLDLS